MSHAIILPILLPLFLGALLLIGHTWSRQVRRGISLVGCLALLPVAWWRLRCVVVPSVARLAARLAAVPEGLPGEASITPCTSAGISSGTG